MTDSRLENRIILFIMVLILGLTAFFIVMADRQQALVMESLIDEDSGRIRKIYQFTLKSLYHELENVAHNIAQREGLLPALDQADIPELNHRLGSIYKTLKEDNGYISRFRYHSFRTKKSVRISEDGIGEYGEGAHSDVVIQAISSSKVQTGVETDGAIRFCIAVPVGSGGRMNGIMEFGVDVDYMLDMLVNEFDIKSIMLIKEEYIRNPQMGERFVKSIDGYGIIRSNCGSFNLVNRLDEINNHYTILRTKESTDRLLFKGADLHNCMGSNVGQIILVKKMDFFTRAMELFKWVLGISSVIMVAVIFFILRYGFGFYIRDVKQTHRKLLHKNRILGKLTNLDHLTKVANRRRIDEVIQKEFKRAHRYDQPLSIILFDVDNFKKINDVYGHNRGDKVLKTIAKLVRASVRESDYFGRWGGEEFVIVCTETTAEGAEKVAEKLRHVISEYEFDEVGTLTCSFGVSQFDLAESIEVSVHHADKALYKAKADGKNRVVRHHKDF